MDQLRRIVHYDAAAIYLNDPATLLVEHLNLGAEGWSRLDSILRARGRGGSIVAHPANEGIHCR